MHSRQRFVALPTSQVPKGTLFLCYLSTVDLMPVRRSLSHSDEQRLEDERGAKTLSIMLVRGGRISLPICERELTL